MLRHIISVSLAMAACASLIPTKANAIDFTLTPLGSLQRNPGDKISFIIALDPENEGGVEILRVYQPSVFNPGIGTYDSNELFLERVQPLVNFSNPVTIPRDIAALVFEVIKPIKDGQPDVSARVDYRRNNVFSSIFLSANSSNSSLDVQPVPEPVPEPLTIFGTAIGLGCGALFKRKFSKKTVA
jgi:hypothetical protein